MLYLQNHKQILITLHTFYFIYVICTIFSLQTNSMENLKSLSDENWRIFQMTVEEYSRTLFYFFYYIAYIQVWHPLHFMYLFYIVCLLSLQCKLIEVEILSVLLIVLFLIQQLTNGGLTDGGLWLNKYFFFNTKKERGK